ncbi:unnamed protein product [Boreogadus saida]
MPGSSATKAPTTGSEVAAETCNAAAPGLSIRRGEAGRDAPSSLRSESSDSKLTRRERASSSGTVNSLAHSTMAAAVSALRWQGESAKTAFPACSGTERGWGAEEAVVHLALALEGTAARVLDLDQADQRDLQALIRALERRLGPVADDVEEGDLAWCAAGLESLQSVTWDRVREAMSCSDDMRTLEEMAADSCNVLIDLLP